MQEPLEAPRCLAKQAKALVAQSGRTMGSLVEEALRARLAVRPSTDAPVPSLPTVPSRSRPGVNLDDSAALLDLLEGR